MGIEEAGPAPIERRDFLKQSVAAVGAMGAAGAAVGAPDGADAPAKKEEQRSGETQAPSSRQSGKYSGVYAGERLQRVAFPLGGIGAGMICLEGTGALSHFSLRNKPEVFNEPGLFSAISLKTKDRASGGRNVARVLEGPVPGWKIFGSPGAGNGAAGTSYGLPRLAEASFKVRFPFATVSLSDGKLPLKVEITGWSPFEPGDADSSSLPVAALEYQFTNTGSEAHEAVFSFNARTSLPWDETSKPFGPLPRAFSFGEPAPRKSPGKKRASPPPSATRKPRSTALGSVEAGGILLPLPGRMWKTELLTIARPSPKAVRPPAPRSSSRSSFRPAPPGR
jgi:hypothetical protein